MTAVAFLVVAAAGAAIRHVARGTTAGRTPIPLGTLLVNLTGSFLLGLIVGWEAPGATIVAVGGLGALTTFSTFSAEVVELRQHGRSAALTYVTVSVAGGVALAWIGLQLST